MSMFQQTKIFLVQSSDLAKDALHIYVALALFLGACLAFGWEGRQWKPWLLVLLAALAGEAWDIRDTLANGGPVRIGGNWKDLWNTMLAPTVLMLAARYTDAFKPAAPARESEGSGDQPQLPGGALHGERDVL